MSPAGRRWLLGATVALLAVAALGGLAWTFKSTWADSGIRLGFHGWLAMTVAMLGVTALGGGLMWLAFFSARAGWDDLDRES